MRPRHSEIFEAYAKLAEEKGLIKTASEDKKKDKESSELKKYKNDVRPRAGSDDISTIEALYGVKPKPLSGMEYNSNMVELAHPNAVIVSPSYDKLNGLVENINERSNIIRNKIMSKEPSGSVFLLKDAEKELSMALICIGNDMDNADEEELRILADECLDGIKKEADWLDDVREYGHKAIQYIGGNKAEKAIRDLGGVGQGAAAGAVSGALIGAIVTSWAPPLSLAGAGIGALLGGIAGGITGYIFDTSPEVKNIKENAKDLLDQMKDIENVVPEEAPYFSEVKSFIEKLVKASDDYISALNVVQGKNIKNEAPTEAEYEEVKKDTKIFIALIETFGKTRTAFNVKVRTGVFAKAKSSIPHPGFADDIEDVVSSFDSLAVAIDNLKLTMSDVVKKTVDKVKDAKSEETKPEAHKNKPEEVKTEISGNTGKTWDSLDSESIEALKKIFN